jgi:CBS domain containing-hemolysin-like protein
MIELLLLIISLALVLACGLFVAAEFSFITVDRRQVERLAARRDVQAQGVLAGLKTLSTQLSGAQVGITLTNLLIGILAEPALAKLISGPLLALGLPEAVVTPIALILAVSLATVVTMIFGELVPKNLAVTKPLATAKFVQGVQRSFTWVMHYPIRLLNATANGILKRLRITPQEELASARSAEELLTVVRHSASQGSLPAETAFMLKRSLEFSGKNGSDVATPRVRVEFIDLEDSVSKIIELANRTGYSRFPVIKDSHDHVVGIVHIKNAVTVPYARRATTPVKEVMEPPIFVPASVGLDVILEKLRDSKMQLAITIDEFGGTDGIVTIEDLVEELVGEVRDEHDRAGFAIRQLNSTSWLVSGLMRPDEISEVIGITLPEDEDFETLGGLIQDKLEEVPDVGDSVTLDAIDHTGQLRSLKMSVRSMEGHRVDRFILEVLPAEKSRPETES